MSLIKTKFIEDNAVNGAKIRLNNNEALRARNVGDTADIEILKVNTSDVIEFLGNIDMGAFQIKNMADPTDPQDAVTLSFLQSFIGGVTDPKDSCRASSTTALPSNTYDNGVSGVGATLTADANGALPLIDGINLSIGDRVLIKDEGGGTDIANGIYEVTQLGDAGNPWILTRTTDADEDSEVTQGMFVPVAEGAANGGLGFLLTTPDPIIVGTTPLSFTQFGESVEAGQGITKTGQTISVNIAANGGLEFVTDTPTDALAVNFDDADLVDGTTKAGAGGEVAGRRSFQESFTLNGSDITNQYVDLTKVASRDSVKLHPGCGPMQVAGLDYTLSYTGGVGGKTRVSFAGDLATGGAAALVAGDIIYITFDSLDY